MVVVSLEQVEAPLKVQGAEGGASLGKDGGGEGGDNAWFDKFKDVGGVDRGD